MGPHGISWKAALDPDNEGFFEVRERVDYAQAALDQYQKDNASKDAEPGVRPYVVFTRGDVDEGESG